MADERRIVIELTLGGAGKPKEDSDDVSLTDVLKAAQHPFKTLESEMISKLPGNTQLWTYAIGQAKALIKNSGMYLIERYFNLTENYKAEQTLENTMSIISNVAEGYGSIIGGAIVGAKAGPWGALAGAAIGAVSWTASTFIDAQKAFDQQNISLATMNMQSGYQMVRMGLIDDGRGTQN